MSWTRSIKSYRWGAGARDRAVGGRRSHSRGRRANVLMATAAILSAGYAQASTITLAGSENLGTSSTVPSASLGTDGYEFFACNYSNASTTATSATPSGNFTFVSSVSTAGDALYEAATTLTVASNSYTSGVAYKTGTDTNGAFLTLCTITLSGSVPSQFQLGLLGDNINNGQDETDFEVIDTPVVGTATTSATTTDTESTFSPRNDFYLLDISGASSGDTLAILGTRATTNGSAPVILGGITIDPVPEPASLGLMALAGISLLSRRRRRHNPLPRKALR